MLDLNTAFELALGALFINTLTEVAKHYKIATKTALLLTTIALGLIYQAFATFVPQSVQTDIVTFLTSAFGIASGLYLLGEGLLKKLLKK